MPRKHNMVNALLYESGDRSGTNKTLVLHHDFNDLRRLALKAMRPARFELATFGFVVQRSIQLSYGRTRT